MFAVKTISIGLSLVLASPAPERSEAAPSEVESVFDMGLEEPPPPPPQPRGESEVESVFDMGLEEPPPPSPVADAVTATQTDPLRTTQAPPSNLRQAGWGVLVTGFALASVAGVTFGFAERERSRTRRISLAYNLYGTSPRPLPQDIANALDASRRNQTRFAGLAAGFAGSAVVAWVVAGVMLGVARKRRRAGPVQAGLGAVRF